MPKIEKIRITGVRYDKMRKQYENTIFDLTNEEEPQHALLTLVNGGGKGLLLQMLFQVVLPLTTWGKNGENHVDALFYNEKQQFDPYTFHVAMEWKLDTEPDEWLVSGICVTAERKQGQDEEETDTEPHYFLYTGKYRKPSDWTLSTLPLYDDEHKEVLGFEDWLVWLKKHNQQFDVFTKSKHQAYYQYLSSYGIERTEWRHMKDINRDEGGIEHYFKKGLDNYGLFHHLIIPEISSFLQDDQADNLVNLFKDSAVIAQKLPKLLKREESYHSIYSILGPLKSILEEGQSLESQVREHQEQASRLYFGMESQSQSYAHEQQKWMEEKNRLESAHTDYSWQQANLEYAREHRSHVDVSEQLQAAGQRVQALEAELQLLKEQKADLQTDIVYAEYRQLTAELETIENQIRRLESSELHRDEKEQIRAIEAQLQASWQDIQAELLRETEQYHMLDHQFRQELRGLDQQIDQAEQTKLEIRTKLGTFREQIKSHNEKAVHMQQMYGEDINRDPEAVYKKLLKAYEALEERKETWKREIEELHGRKDQWSRQLGEGEAEVKRLSLELQSRTNSRQDRWTAEKKLHDARCRFNQEEIAFQPYSADDWIDAGRQLGDAIYRLQTDLDDMQKEYWKHQIDTALLNDACWIPNDDVRRMKQRLEEVGIQATFGTELIMQLTEEEQERLKLHYPLLPYGLVIHQQDWEKRADTEAFHDLFAHAPVPVFIRERMNDSYDYPYELAQEQGLQMAYDKERWARWKDDLHRMTGNYAGAIAQLKERLQDAGQLADRVQQLQTATYEIYVREEESAQELLVREQVMQRQKKEALVQIDEQLSELRERIRHIDQERDTAQKGLLESEGWIEQHQRFVRIQSMRAEAQEKNLNIEDGLNRLQKNRSELTGELSRWEQQFFRWKVSCESDCKQLQEMIPDARFPESTALHTGEAVRPHLRSTIFQEVHPLIRQWQRLQQQLNNSDSELTEWRTKRTYCLQEQQKARDQLDQLETSWMERRLPELPVEIMKQQLRQLEAELDRHNGELRNADGNANKLSGTLDQIVKTMQSMAKRILEEHRRPAESWQGIDLTLKHHEIAREMKRVKEDLRMQQSIISELEDKRQQLEKQLDILKTHISDYREAGDVPDSWREQIRTQPDKLTQQWIALNKELDKRMEAFQKSFKDKLRELGAAIQHEQIDTPLRNNMNQLLPQLESDSVRVSLDIVSSVMEHIQLELQRLQQDKLMAEEAKEMWVERAVYQVFGILQALKRMVNRMKIKNKEGHLFPLVDIERLNEILAADEEEYRRLLREYFILTVEKLFESDQPIDQLTEAQVKQHISDSQLVLTVLRNRYPTLYIYKPQTTNAFLVEKPRKHHYTTWETLNKGSKVEAKGSGGQLLAARTILMMMIMTFKRQVQSNHWSVLITDNPFGQAVSSHVLDPIFSIADILRFQWIVLAPPELIKLDVSRRFPVYWKLELQPLKHGEVITEVLQHGGRTYEDTADLFSFL